MSNSCLATPKTHRNTFLRKKNFKTKKIFGTPIRYECRQSLYSYIYLATIPSPGALKAVQVEFVFSLNLKSVNEE